MKTLHQHIAENHEGNRTDYAKTIGCTPQHVTQCVQRGAMIDSHGQLWTPINTQHKIIDGVVYRQSKSGKHLK